MNFICNSIMLFINNFKLFEKDAGIYKLMSETDKEEFLNNGLVYERFY